MDIVERLDDPELYVDAVDDAIAEIKRLRKMLKRVKNTWWTDDWDTPEEDAAWKEL